MATNTNYGGTQYSQQIQPLNQPQTQQQGTSPISAALATGTQSAPAPTGQQQPQPQAATGYIPLSSPVTSTGQIPPPSAGQVSTAGAPQPQAASAPAPAAVPQTGTIYAPGAPPGGRDPFLSMGGGVRLPNGNWVPRNHPLAAPYVGGGGQPSPGGGGSPTPFPANINTPPGPPPPGYTPGQVPPDLLPQIQLPDQAAANAAQMQLLMQLLQNPESFTDQGVSMLQEQQKEQALAREAAMRQQIQQGAASRGTFGGGFMAGQERRLGDATTQQLLQSYRDIAIQRMLQDQEDRRAALGVSEDVLGGQTGRAIDINNLILQRALSGEDLMQQGAASELARYGASLDRYFGQREAESRDTGLDIQRDLGEGALAVDRSRIGESGRQFNLSHVLDWARLRSQDELGRLGIGADLSGQQLQSQRDLQRLLFG